MGFEFDIQYKEGSSNSSVDALPVNEGAKLLPMLLDKAHPNLFGLIQKE